MKIRALEHGEKRCSRTPKALDAATAQVHNPEMRRWLGIAFVCAALIALFSIPMADADPGCTNPDGSACAPAGPGCVDPNNSLPCSSSLPDVNAAIRHELQSILGGSSFGMR
jgi:hypothetical protein